MNANDDWPMHPNVLWKADVPNHEGQILMVSHKGHWDRPVTIWFRTGKDRLHVATVADRKLQFHRNGVGPLAPVVDFIFEHRETLFELAVCSHIHLT